MKTVKLVFFIFIVSSLFAWANPALSLTDTLTAIGSGRNVELRWDPFFGSGVFALGDHFASFYAKKLADIRKRRSFAGVTADEFQKVRH